MQRLLLAWLLLPAIVVNRVHSQATPGQGEFESIAKSEGESFFTLSCVFEQDVKVKWTRFGNQSLNSLNITLTFGQSGEDDPAGNRAFLIFPKLKPIHSGDYVCDARSRNAEPVGRKTYRLIVKPTETTSGSGTPGTDSGAYIGGISVTIVVVTLLIVWILFEFFRKPKNGLTKTEIEEFLLGNMNAIQNNGYAHENAPYMPYNETYEIAENKLYVDPKDVLGSGAFGLVLKGKVNNKPVAVKTLRPGIEKTYLKSLLAELKIMIYLGPHENIVNLVGASTKKLALGSVYIVVDCCNLGSLDKYIREHKSKFVNQYDNSWRLTRSLDCPEMCTNDLIIWSAQIANGMAFMGSKNVIHGDLASRNVLLSDRHTAKISDFGLSRQLYDYTTNYKKQNMEPLPWRWMAYESLKELNFSCNSDIWSYGITLWEIFTIGDLPYPGLAWTNDFVESLLENKRLAKPRFASPEIYHQMLRCWHIDPTKRASFKNSRQFFRDVADSGFSD